MKFKIYKKNLYKLQAVLLLLYFNFPFYLRISVSLQQLFLWGICVFYIVINNNNITKKLTIDNLQSGFVKIFFSLFYVFSILIFLVPVVHNTTDISYYRRMAYFILCIIQYLVVFIYIEKNIAGNCLITYIDCFITSCTIYVAISIFMFLNPSFKEFWKTIIHASGLNAELTNEIMYVSRFGLAGFSGFPATFMCSTAVIFSLYMIVRGYNQTVYFLKMILTLLGNFFYGRVGMLCSFVCIFLFIMYYIVRKRNTKMLVVSVFVALVIFIVLSQIYSINPMVKAWIDWAFGPFRNLITIGKFGTASSDTLIQDMYFMPSNKTLLFGDGKYMDKNRYYMHTDAGFMRLLLYAGVFVQGILYVSILSLLFGVCFSFKKKSKLGCIFIFMLLGFEFLFFEFKGEIYFRFFSVLLPLAMFNYKKSQEIVFKNR